MPFSRADGGGPKKNLGKMGRSPVAPCGPVSLLLPGGPSTPGGPGGPIGPCFKEYVRSQNLLTIADDRSGNTKCFTLL